MTGPVGDTRRREHYESMLAGLYDEYYRKIAHYAYVRIGERAEAEDIAGEVFLKALDSLGSYRERGIPMQAWLFRIAHNLVVDYLRGSKKYSHTPIETQQCDGEDPSVQAERNIEIERVKAAMSGLTKEQREVVSLRFFGGLTSKEVAGILNKKDGAVREMQRAAIEKLRMILVLDRD